MWILKVCIHNKSNMQIKNNTIDSCFEQPPVVWNYVEYKSMYPALHDKIVIIHYNETVQAVKRKKKSWHFTEYPKKYANSSDIDVLCGGLVPVNITNILQGYFTGTGAIIWLPQCQLSNPEEYW